MWGTPPADSAAPASNRGSRFVCGSKPGVPSRNRRAQPSTKRPRAPPPHQRAALRDHGQPVAGFLLAADENLEAAVGTDGKLRIVEIAGGREASAGAVAPFLGAKAEIVHGAARARHPVLVFAADGRVL